MRRFISSCLFFVAGVGLLAACGPSYYLTMQPQDSSGLWADGRPAARQVQDSVEVRLSFVRYDGGRMVFDADFRNHSRRALRVGPSGIAYQPVLTQPVAATSATPAYGNVLAFDPEPEVQNLSSRLAEASQQATHVSTGEVLTNIGHVVSDLASLKKTETKEQQATREAKQQSEKDYYTRQRLEAAAAADQLRAQLQELEGNALRQHTMEPGERKHGYVYFPRFDTADLLRVKVSVREQELTFDFTQTRTPQ